MVIDAALSALEGRLHALLEALTFLHTAVVADQPQPAAADTPALVDILGDGAENLVGCAMEALDAARGAQAAALRGDMQGMRRALAACHEQALGIGQRLLADLMPYERIADLARVGRTRGGEWRAWAASVKQALEACPQPLLELQQALLACWQEAAERGEHPARATTAV